VFTTTGHETVAARVCIGECRRSTADTQGSPQDYPQWRGRNGDGAASAFIRPKAWPKTLTRRWRIDVGEGYGTPLVIGDTVYVFTRRDDNEVMTAVAAATGAERWRSSYLAPASGNGVAAFKPTKRDGRWVTETVWQTDDVSMYLSNPVVIGDTLFGLSQRSSGEYFALDARTGKVVWLGQPRQATNTAVVKADDLLFLLNDDAELIVARASQTRFEPIARYTVADSATWAQPAISGNRIFIKDVSSLTLWTIE
jgi:outer membrane protein assembly factor BamB